MTYTETRKMNANHSIEAGHFARTAILAYARAAAHEEKCEDGNSAGQMWFVVRALAAEHGMNYPELMSVARMNAA